MDLLPLCFICLLLLLPVSKFSWYFQVLGFGEQQYGVPSGKHPYPFQRASHQILDHPATGPLSLSRHWDSREVG